MELSEDLKQYGPEVSSFIERMCLVSQRKPDEVIARLIALGIGVLLKETNAEDNRACEYFYVAFQDFMKLEDAEKWKAIAHAQYLIDFTCNGLNYGQPALDGGPPF